ncbi:double zinc ribbon and ankyrin repeat-containing 1 isoform X1 [Pelobates cultripes]|uniref:Double zinc ribbon and ankyrin repeat-containing protein 1 n=1 Tax=Pelobates cultripes TaxID=61616 RepID=A0AAD1RGY4_PELCU|nr:double zinc ribbon and ankyrin repeat-containing 1 isoform X1 [Pelobates cultripes]
MTAGSISVPQIIPLRVPPPGRSKYEIDTNTSIEIKSDSRDVTIFYTLDGSKPDLYKKVGFGENATLKYKGPFTLPDGKITVKALAATRDGRESGTVTKIFMVEFVPPVIDSSDEDNDENFLKDLSKQDFGISLTSTKTKKKTRPSERTSVWDETVQTMKDSEIDGRNSHRSFKEPRFMNSRLGKPNPGEEPVSSLQTQRSQMNGFTEPIVAKSLTSTQAMRIQRETDFLKCAHCLASRPSDPFASFCQECGAPVPPVPGRRLPPPEGAQMGLCVECRSMVPMNTPSCIVCEAPLSAQMQPQASINLKDKAICRFCGTGNPINLKHCVTCEAKLPVTQTPIYSGESAPPLPNQQGKMQSCSKCGRVNLCDARFCDWCGAKPGLSVHYLTCSKCSASNHPYAHFCSSCGVYLEPPARYSSHNGRMLSSRELIASFTGDGENRTSWQPITLSLPKGRLESEKNDKGTQTVGLFYPSSKLIEKKEIELLSEKEKKEKMSDRKPLVTAISPGRGYWRQQLDHICAHLRCYTQNNSEFKALIGQPRMGRIISATMHEDGYEVSLRLNYVLVTDKNVLTGKPMKFSGNHFLSSVTEGRDEDTQSSIASEDGQSARSSNGKSKRTKKKTRKPLQKEDRLSPEDRKLLKEVGPKGEGDISNVEELLDEGADPNCTNNEDRPVLTVAVLNGHHKVIPVLVQKGADIDQQSGPHNNTALHESVMLGLVGKKCTEVLLGCNASIKKKNDKGLTAHDLALKSGNEEISSLFASKLGQGMLDKLIKPKGISLDVF